MSDDALDVLGIGNAIVDVIAPADDEFLAAHAMHKGSMALIDQEQAERIYAAMGATIVSSGGSAANTIAGVASLGGRPGFIGKVRDDELGAEFRHDITAAGARFTTAPATDGPATARCLVLVTPDSQRTLNTFLGAAAELGPSDVDAQLVASANITYLEGYLYDAPSAQQAFHLAAEIAHAANHRVALTLSDPFCVQRHRDAFLDLVGHHVDVLFANLAEASALFETDRLDRIVEGLRSKTDLVALTRGPDGSLIVTHDDVIEVRALRIGPVVDTTGAGDLYAAGFLYGLTHGLSLHECGRLGSLAAAEAIAHFGARPQTNLRELARERTLLQRA